MKIALLGYGKMGKTIEKCINKKAVHSIVLRANSKEQVEQIKYLSNPDDKPDVAIEFSAPSAAIKNIELCIRSGLPIVCGTTGWLEKMDEIKDLIQEFNGSMVYASNFSIGVNLTFAANEWLAQKMANYESYRPGIKEIHHTTKLDAPSGTAISLAEQLIKASPHLSNWKNQVTDSKDTLQIVSERLEDVKGTHIVSYDSPVDSIRLVHEAHSREGFANGAILAAEWVVNKKGLYDMRDVLGL